MRLLALIPLLLCCVQASALTLAEDGATEYVIAIADDAIPAEHTAAAELRGHLALVTGADFEVLPEQYVEPGRKCIFVGPCRALKKAFPGLDPSVGKDAMVMKTAGDDLFLAGDRPRGTLYAVYTFLEDVVGVRWWSASERYLPEKAALRVPRLDEVYVPALRCREAFYRGALDGVHAARLKLNGHHMQIPESHGGHYRILGWCHTFDQLLPPEEHFDAHPEWYSEVDGKRVKATSQLCLTNDAMRAALTAKALEWLRADPGAGIISVSQNDWHNRCQCANCLAVEEEEGAPSGPLIRFVNAVAEDIEKEFPDALVCTLAYQYTRKAPKLVRPRRNVIVRLCSIECDFSRPLTAPENAAFLDDLKAWSAISPQLYIWDYVTNFRNLIAPHPNFQVLAPNLRLFVDNKAIGLFEQGDVGSSCSEFPELRAWLLAHLMWKPQSDERALVKEFMHGYYGAAAKPLLQYLKVMRKAMEQSGEALRCFERTTEPWLDLKTLNRATELFDAAEAAVQDDAALLARVQRARMPVDNTWLARYYDLKAEADASGAPFRGPADPRAFVDQFIKRARGFSVGTYAEGRPFEERIPRLRARFRPAGPAPEELKGAAPASFVDVQDNLFSLHGEGNWVALVEDAAASDGMAARMPGAHTSWAVQVPVTPRMAALGRARCCFVVRADAKAASGAVCRVGLWDGAANQSVAEASPTVTEAGGSAYQRIDLGAYELKEGMYFWVAPMGDASAVEAVYVDRIYCVRDE